jgi:hypothetical protein
MGIVIDNNRGEIMEGVWPRIAGTVGNPTGEHAIGWNPNDIRGIALKQDNTPRNAVAFLGCGLI